VPCAEKTGAFPVEDFSQAAPEFLDTLPFGVIRVDGAGKILSYSRGEAAYSGLSPSKVIGKNFFTQVAPCTKVKEFAGELEKLRATRANGTTGLSFVFKFPKGTALMSIVVIYEASSDISTLLIRPVGSFAPLYSDQDLGQV